MVDLREPVNLQFYELQPLKLRPTNVLIVHSLPLVSEGIASIIRERDPNINTAVRGTPGEAFCFVRDYFQCKNSIVSDSLFKPDVVLMPLGPSAPGATEKIRALFDPNFAVIADEDNDENLFQAVAMEARALITLRTNPNDVLDTIRRVNNGETLFPAERLAKLFVDPLRKIIPEVKVGKGEQLTPREQEVLLLISIGLNKKVIASELVISESTASTHIEHIFGKLNVNSKLDAVLEAQRRGLLSRPNTN